MMSDDKRLEIFEDAVNEAGRKNPIISCATCPHRNPNGFCTVRFIRTSLSFYCDDHPQAVKNE